MRPDAVSARPGSGEPFPLLVRLADVPCLVVGGGTAGVAKVRTLLAAGARVRVVAREVSPELLALARRSAGGSSSGEDAELEVVRRAFRSKDVCGQRLVVAATGRTEVDRAVVEAARREGAWVVASGAPELGNALMPAVWRGGAVVVAVSTSGRSPTAAVWLRDRLAAALPSGLVALVDAAGALREELRATGWVVPRAAWFRALDAVVEALEARGSSKGAGEGEGPGKGEGEGERASAVDALRAALESALESGPVGEHDEAGLGAERPAAAGEADLTGDDGFPAT